MSEPLRHVFLNACAYEKEERFSSTTELYQAIEKAIEQLPDVPEDTISLKQQAAFCAKQPENAINEEELISVTWKNELEPAFVFDTSIRDGEKTHTNWMDADVIEKDPTKIQKRHFPKHVLLLVVGVFLLGALLITLKNPPLPDMNATCRAFAQQLLSQQKKSGGFAGIVQAGASLWDSGQQFYALRWSENCGVRNEKVWDLAISYLENESSRHAIDLAWASLALSSPKRTAYLKQLSEYRLINGMYAFEKQDKVGDWYTTLLALWANCGSGVITAKQREKTLHILLEKMDGHFWAGLDEQLMWIRLEHGSTHPELLPDKEELDTLILRLTKRCAYTTDGCTAIRWPDSQLGSSNGRFTLSFHGKPWAIALLVHLVDHPQMKSDPRVDDVFRWLVQKEYDSRGELMGNDNYRLSEHVFALGVYESRSH